ncbi:MAG TPA: hypothetical protein VNK48_14445 [Xanthobacteraceae bacterium]|nr:hypothetical protein [Xanthobacteraceae bacterium]
MANGSALGPMGAGEIIESVIAKGDLAKLTSDERTRYYIEVCKSVGVNPLTKPFDYIMLEGRLTLYARKDCTDQLRKINRISIEIVSRELADDLYTVHVRATDKDGRQDEDCGAVMMVYPEKMRGREGWTVHPKAGKPLKGVDRANAIMKAVTKAKRRVTLSISGLGFPDESELEDMAIETAEPKKAEAVTPVKSGERKPLPPLIVKKAEAASDAEPEAEAAAEPEAPEAADDPQAADDVDDRIVADFEKALAACRSVSGLNAVCRDYATAYEAMDEERKARMTAAKERAAKRLAAKAKPQAEAEAVE